MLTRDLFNTKFFTKDEFLKNKNNYQKFFKYISDTWLSYSINFDDNNKTFQLNNNICEHFNRILNDQVSSKYLKIT